jgi:hypothetical protein
VPAEFKASFLERMEDRLGEHNVGELKRESAESKAERIIRDELKRLKWPQQELRQRPKSDSAKLAIAARLRREKTLTLRWIAARLHAGTWKSLNAKLHRWRKINEPDENRSRLSFVSFTKKLSPAQKPRPLNNDLPPLPLQKNRRCAQNRLACQYLIARRAPVG